MDPLSLSLSCIALLQPIAQALTATVNFVRDVRDARNDMDLVSRELHSLEYVLKILADDTGNYHDENLPSSFVERIKETVVSCGDIVKQIAECLESHTGNRGIKGAMWVAGGREKMTKLRTHLEAYKSGLNIAVDMLGLYVSSYSLPFLRNVH